MFRFFLLCIVATVPSNSMAAENPLFSGRIFADVFAPDKDVKDSTFRQVSTSLWIQGDPKFSETTLAHFVLTGDAFDVSQTSSGNHAFRTGLREGSVSYIKPSFEIRLGQQIIPWGKSDVINPTDFLTAKDYTFFNPDTEVQRIGATAAWFSFTPNQGNSPLNFNLVWIPIFAESRPLIAPSQVPSGINLASSPNSPSATLGNSETALKASYTGAGWDASLSLFRGWNHLPDFQITGITGTPLAPSASIAETFHKIRAVGADASYTSGKYIYRLETAYIWTDNNDGTNPLIQPSSSSSVVGVERPIGNDFRLQTQFVYRYYPNFTPPNQAGGSDPVTAVLNPQIASVNAQMQNYQNQSRPSGTIRFAYDSDARGISAEVFALVNFVGWDYFIQPKFSYAFSDAFKGTVGVQQYGGPTSRPLGVLSAYNSAFVEAKYVF